LNKHLIALAGLALMLPSVTSLPVARAADPGRVTVEPGDRALFVQAENASVETVFSELAQALEAEIAGLEAVDTKRRVTGQIRAPLDRILAWLAPDRSYALFWDGAGDTEADQAYGAGVRIVFFPDFGPRATSRGVRPTRRSTAKSYRGVRGRRDLGRSTARRRAR
jgi:hypothetical protein